MRLVILGFGAADVSLPSAEGAAELAGLPMVPTSEVLLLKVGTVAAGEGAWMACSTD